MTSRRREARQARRGRLRVAVVGPVGFVWVAIKDSVEGDQVEVVGAPTAYLDSAGALALKPDVVVVDLDAAGSDWPQLVSELHQLLPSTVIVVLALFARDEAVLEAVGAGAAGFLTKDLSGDALRRSIEGIGKGELAMSRTTAALAMRALQSRAQQPRGRGRVPGAGLEGLTRRELDVLALAAEGLTDREVADRLSLSVRTVETHMAQIRRRLGVRARSQAVLVYLRAEEASRGAGGGA